MQNQRCAERAGNGVGGPAIRRRRAYGSGPGAARTNKGQGRPEPSITVPSHAPDRSQGPFWPMYPVAMARLSSVDKDLGWRSGPESNRHSRICSPLHHHSATGPSRGCGGEGAVIHAAAGWVKRGKAHGWHPRVRPPISGRSSPRAPDEPDRHSTHPDRLRRARATAWSTARCGPTR